MGQPGCMGGDGDRNVDKNICHNIYYYNCIDCEEYKRSIFGNMGRYPKERIVKVDDCRHRGSDKSFEANGAVCTGYEPGFKSFK